jgi:hypothetical protein
MPVGAGGLLPLLNMAIYRREMGEIRRRKRAFPMKDVASV